MSDRKKRTWPLWLQTLGLIVLGWAITLAAIYGVAYEVLPSRAEGLIIAGPVLMVVAIYMSVKEVLDRRKQR